MAVGGWLGADGAEHVCCMQRSGTSERAHVVRGRRTARACQSVGGVVS